jgi:heat shock protein HtpX
VKNIYEVQTSNKVKSYIIVALFAVFIFISTYILTQAMGFYMGYEPGGLGFLGLSLIITGTSTFISYYFSDRIVLGISGARPANSAEDRVFTSVAENLCIGAGIPKPKLYVIEDTAPNAFATGRDPEHAVVCATTGLLQKLSRTELEGVIAHELTHIRNYDVRLMSVVSVMVGLIALLADWFLRMSYFGRSRDNDRGGSFGAVILVLGIVFAILSPIIGQLIRLAISRRREFMADSGAISITRQPEGLMNALMKISTDQEPLEAANKATAHLYISSPFKTDSREGHMHKNQGSVAWFANLFNTHPPIRERIRLLKEMA